MLVHVARDAAFGHRARIGFALRAGPVLDEQCIGGVRRARVTRGALGLSVRSLEQKRTGVIEAAAQHVFAHAVPAGRDVARRAGGSHSTVVLVEMAARALAERETAELEVRHGGRGARSTLRQRRVALRAFDPRVQAGQQISGLVVGEPGRVVPAFLPVARVAGTIRELVIVRIISLMTREALGLEPEVGVGQGAVPPLERPHVARANQWRRVAFPAIERRMSSLRLPADLRMLELRGLPAYESEVAPEVLLVAAGTAIRGVGSGVVALAGVDASTQRGVTVEAQAGLDPPGPQLVARGARTDALELRVDLGEFSRRDELSVRGPHERAEEEQNRRHCYQKQPRKPHWRPTSPDSFQTRAAYPACT